jgi:5'-3' exonuclease
MTLQIIRTSDAATAASAPLAEQARIVPATPAKPRLETRPFDVSAVHARLSPVTDRLMLLDTASLYFRAFYGVPDTVKAPDGSPVNAARGLLDIIAKLVTTYEPTRMVACWDDDWRPQWRVDLIPSYKTHRVVEVVAGSPDIEEVPDPLEAQIPLIRETLDVLGIPVIGVAEHEADDVIGTLATHAALPVDIVTGDRDLFQLVDDARGVRVIYTARGMSNLEVVTDATVVAKYGVLPGQYADFATMRGDASDGLPGVAGVGEKTAATLLQAHGDLTGIREAAEAGEGMSAGVRAKILAASDYLDVAPTVVAVATDLDISAPDALLRSPDTATLARAAELAEKWNLGTSMTRAVTAISAVGSNP